MTRGPGVIRRCLLVAKSLSRTLTWAPVSAIPLIWVPSISMVTGIGGREYCSNDSNSEAMAET